MTLSWPVIMCNKPRLEISIRHAILFLSTFNEIDYVNYIHADFIIFYTEGHPCLLDYHVNMQHLAFFSIFGSTRTVEIDSKELTDLLHEGSEERNNQTWNIKENV